MVVKDILIEKNVKEEKYMKEMKLEMIQLKKLAAEEEGKKARSVKLF